MSLDVVWFVVVAVFWTGFFVLEGFDFGVGALHKVVGRTDLERRVAINTIGPVWDGNEVWLIVGGAAIFAAFPSWYATWFSAGYLALFLVLVALIIRGVSFEWRAKVDADRWRGTWSWTLTVGSVLVPAAARGRPGRPAGRPPDRRVASEFTGSFWDLLTPYGLWLGLTLLVLCLLHGATFLGLKTDGPVRDRATGLAARLAWPAAVPRGRRTPCGPSRSPTAGLWRVVAARRPRRRRPRRRRCSIRSGHEGRSFAATAVTIGGTVAALFANLYPNVMVSSTTTANNLTVNGTASSELRPEGHDRRRRGDHPRGPALPGLVLLGLPSPGQRTARGDRRDRRCHDEPAVLTTGRSLGAVPAVLAAGLMVSRRRGRTVPAHRYGSSRD